MSKKSSPRDSEEFLSLSTLVLFVANVFLFFAFIFLLNRSLGLPFNIIALIISLVLATIVTIFLVVVKSVMKTNKLEGLIVGLSIIVVANAALLIKFHGPNTYTFATIGSLIAIIYLIYNFLVLKGAT